jgi:periplasmic copper chaperone A
MLDQHNHRQKEMMKNLNRFGWLVASLLFSLASYAGDIEISGAWTRATAPGQEQAGVDLTITSKQAATIVGVSSPAAKSAALHSMTTEGGMMRMREVKEIELPAGKSVNLGESGYHLMLEGLNTPLKEGESVPVTLHIKVGNQAVLKLETKAEVRPLTATQTPAENKEHMDMPMNY